MDNAETALTSTGINCRNAPFIFVGVSLYAVSPICSGWRAFTARDRHAFGLQRSLPFEVPSAKVKTTIRQQKTVLFVDAPLRLRIRYQPSGTGFGRPTLRFRVQGGRFRRLPTVRGLDRLLPCPRNRISSVMPALPSRWHSATGDERTRFHSRRSQGTWASPFQPLTRGSRANGFLGAIIWSCSWLIPGCRRASCSALWRTSASRSNAC